MTKKYPPGFPQSIIDLLESGDREPIVLDISGKRRDKPAAPLMEARIEELRSFVASYHAPNTFKVGDLIHPKKNSTIIGYGLPHIVVEVLDNPEWHWTGHPSAPDFGRRVNIRIIGVSDRHDDGDAMVPWWGEHFQYELFDPEADYK